MVRNALITLAALWLVVAPSRADLVVHYNFNGNALDSSGNGNNGTIIGPPVFVAGQSDQAIYFNNPLGGVLATQYVNLPNSASILGLQNSSFTFSLSYKSLDNAPSPVVGYDVNGRLFGGGGLVYDYADGSGLESYTSVRDTSNHLVRTDLDVRGNPASITADGNWHSAVVVIDRSAGDLKQYIDAVLIVTESLAGLGSVDFSNLSIGRVSFAPTFGARLTTVDDFRLYDRALTSDEVRALNQAVPEPSSLFLFGLATMWLAGRRGSPLIRGFHGRNHGDLGKDTQSAGGLDVRQR